MSEPIKWPPVPSPPGDTALYPLEAWYLDCFRLFVGAVGRSPSIVELATYVGRSPTATHRALIRIETRGVLARDRAGKFYEPAPRKRRKARR